MKPSYRRLAIVCGIAVAVIGLVWWGISRRNHFVALDETVNAAWSQVENQYQRRLDLIPNLVETVKGYAAHESGVYEGVARARAGLSDAYNAAQAAQAEGQPASDAQAATFSAAQSRLKDALSIYVNAVREAYPDLKANDQFLSLQAQLEGTENRIAVERKRYIDTVNGYNTQVRQFPASIFASMAGCTVRPQFKAEEGAATAPKVQF